LFYSRAPAATEPYPLSLHDALPILTLPFLFVYLNQARGLAAGTVGLLVGWMGLVALVLAPLGGSLVDRYGARHVVLPLLVVEAVGTASLALVHDTVSALLALTVAAVGGSA